MMKMLEIANTSYIKMSVEAKLRNHKILKAGIFKVVEQRATEKIFVLRPAITSAASISLHNSVCDD